ncbi:MAG: isochorismatase family protein [Lentisphaeria bacterium]|nr:isochorismatase family protein [Lentisphaeria bacterium]
MLFEVENSLLVVVDVQQKLMKAMSNSELCEAKVKLLANALTLMNVPVIVTEQYPKGLGPTVDSVKEVLNENTAFVEKSAFSCCGAEEFNQKLLEYDRKNIILCGVESHVCVLQTAMALLNKGYTVTLAADAASSRNENDKALALSYLRHNGVSVLSTESIIFALLKDSKHPAFKAVSALLK